MTQDELIRKAYEIRLDVVRMIAAALSGHPAGSLGMAEVFTALYFKIMHHDPKNPNWDERDRLLLSSGHICPVLYATLAHAGYFPVKELSTLRKLGSRLQGHPEKERLPGVEISSGSLGMGLAQAAGYAYAARMDKKRFRVYCITSDGEHDCGNHWEGVLFSAKYKLSNLTMFVDRNKIQIDGYTEEVMPLEPLEDKYRAFNWNVVRIDGHNFEEIIQSVNCARSNYEKPTVVISQTIAGKGVSFMENKPEWHGKTINEDEAKLALNEIKNKLKKL